MKYAYELLLITYYTLLNFPLCSLLCAPEFITPSMHQDDNNNR